MPILRKVKASTRAHNVSAWKIPHHSGLVTKNRTAKVLQLAKYVNHAGNFQRNVKLISLTLIPASMKGRGAI